MKLSRDIVIILLVVLCSSWAWSYTSHEGVPPCPPKPYPVVFDYSRFPDSLRPAMREFIDHMNYQIIDEIYLRLCNYIADTVFDGNCFARLDTIQACTWPDTCDTGDPWYDWGGQEAPTVTVNTQIFQLLAKPIDDAHNISSCTPDPVFMETPILRFRGGGGDSLDISWVGTLDSSESPTSTLYYLPGGSSGDPTMGGETIWSFNPLENDTLNVSRRAYVGKQYPNPALVQGGRVDINTEQTHDTIVFASTYSALHGGAKSGGGAIWTDPKGNVNPAGWPVWSSINASVNLEWGPDAANYFTDSLWLVSVTDTSFVVGIEYSATARVLSWQVVGIWRIPWSWPLN